MLICQYLHDEYSGRMSHSSPGMLWNELVATCHFKLRCLRCRSVGCVAVVVLFHLATFSGRYRWPLVHSCSRWWRLQQQQHQIAAYQLNIRLHTSATCSLSPIVDWWQVCFVICLWFRGELSDNIQHFASWYCGTNTIVCRLFDTHHAKIPIVVVINIGGNW